MSEREPKRTRKPYSVSPDVSKAMGGKRGFAAWAKGGRAWRPAEHGPVDLNRPTTRGDGTR